MAGMGTMVKLVLLMTIAVTLVLGITDNSNLLFKLVTDPASLNITQVLMWLAFTSAIGISGTLIGVFVFKNDVFIFGVPFTMLIGLAHPTMVVFFNELSTINVQFAAVVVGIIYLTYIFSCIDWLRTGRAA